jgi:hypothetical protein
MIDVVEECKYYTKQKTISSNLFWLEPVKFYLLQAPYEWCLYLMVIPCLAIASNAIPSRRAEVRN